MGSGSDDKSRLEKLGKLCSKLREVQAQEFEIVEEMRRLLGGEAGIGETLKRVQAYFDGVWCHRYAPGQHGKYVWAFVKDVPQIKRLLKSLDPAALELRMATYLRDEDPFYVKARHPFGLFVSNVNRFASAAPMDLELASPTISDCKHRPPCRSDQEHTKRRSDDMRGML